MGHTMHPQICSGRCEQLGTGTKYLLNLLSSWIRLRSCVLGYDVMNPSDALVGVSITYDLANT